MTTTFYPAPPGPLPTQQKRVWDFILSRGSVPSKHEIAEHMGWKQSASAHDCLHRLCWRGFLTYDYSARTFAIAPDKTGER